jgi:ribosomal protein S27AE
MTRGRLRVEALDGNALAGELFELCGVEMTTARGTCAHCGIESLIAELRVYGHPPAEVVRCPHCGGVVMVLVTAHGRCRIRSESFRLAELHHVRH